MSRTRIKRKNEPTSKSPWPFVVMGIGAVLIVVVGFLAWRGNTSVARSANATPQATGGPKLSVDRDSIDFGKLPLDQSVRAEFKLKNVGDQPLAIKGEPRVELVKGCWPPRAVVGSTTLNTGQETTLSMGFMMHAGMDGTHEFRVHVLTNDPKEPEKLLTVISYWGKWDTPFRLFFNTSNGARIQQPAEVQWSHLQERVALLSVRRNQPWCKILYADWKLMQRTPLPRASAWGRRSTFARRRAWPSSKRNRTPTCITRQDRLPRRWRRASIITASATPTTLSAKRGLSWNRLRRARDTSSFPFADFAPYRISLDGEMTGPNDPNSNRLNRPCYCSEGFEAGRCARFTPKRSHRVRNTRSSRVKKRARELQTIPLGSLEDEFRWREMFTVKSEGLAKLVQYQPTKTPHHLSGEANSSCVFGP